MLINSLVIIKIAFGSEAPQCIHGPWNLSAKKKCGHGRSTSDFAPFKPLRQIHFHRFLTDSPEVSGSFVLGCSCTWYTVLINIDRTAQVALTLVAKHLFTDGFHLEFRRTRAACGAFWGQIRLGEILSDTQGAYFEGRIPLGADFGPSATPAGTFFDPEIALIYLLPATLLRPYTINRIISFRTSDE
jgi:hypothetical protein